VTADSLKRAVKGFWVPRTGVLSSHAFEKGTEWSRTDAELPVQAKLVVAYGRLRKEEADRRNRAHAAAAAEVAPRGCRVDGNLIKRIASGGDQIEVRTNYKDETRKKLQCTMFVYCNDFPPVEPSDAYQSLDVFDFYTSFHPQDEMDARGDSCPKHWKAADPNIKTLWVTDPLVLDAFTMTVLVAWTLNLLPAPDSVSQHTKQFKESASEAEIDRFAEVVRYDPTTVNTKVFVEEIKIALEHAGVKGVSSYKVGSYVNKLYGDKAAPPVYGQYRILGKKAYGFTHLRLADVVAFDGVQERRVVNLVRNETVRQQVRNGDVELGKRSFDDMEQ